MKVIIMSCDDSCWYKDKIGKVYKVQLVKDEGYVTKDGGIRKKDAQVIER